MNMIEKRKAMAGQGGFTLIELLVVVAILAVLAGAAIIGIGALRDNAETQVCETDQKTVETAAEAWAIENEPATGDTVAVSVLVTDGLLKEDPGNVTTITFTGANQVATATMSC